MIMFASKLFSTNAFIYSIVNHNPTTLQFIHYKTTTSIPSPPPFEFDNDENTPTTSSEPVINNNSNHTNTNNTTNINNNIRPITRILSSICSYLDLQSLSNIEKCCKRIYIIACEPDSFHNKNLTFK